MIPPTDRPFHGCTATEPLAVGARLACACGGWWAKIGVGAYQHGPEPVPPHPGRDLDLRAGFGDGPPEEAPMADRVSEAERASLSSPEGQWARLAIDARAVILLLVHEAGDRVTPATRRLVDAVCTEIGRRVGPIPGTPTDD